MLVVSLFYFTFFPVLYPFWWEINTNKSKLAYVQTDYHWALTTCLVDREQPWPANTGKMTQE